MDLDSIKDPSFLQQLSIAEMEELSQEIREFLIENISHTGGHLASNLGVVELTIALHYVFHSPEDKIFFDVGHQCYTHKILTGRAKDFPTLRQYQGMSGFEKRSESEHDVWEAGHSSTSLSAALGMAIARDEMGKDYAVVPVIGDGALGSGMAFEALNEIGYEKRRMIIVFNDNNMSISRNVGATNYEFARLRASKGYNNFKNALKYSLKKNEFGTHVYSGLKNVKDAIRDSMVDTGIFGELNLDYLGPVDGHNLKDLIQVFEVAKQHTRPIVIHVITKKGKGYLPCEEDRSGMWHGVGPFNPQTGRMLHETPAGYKHWAQIMSDAVEELANRDARINVITPAMIYGSDLQHFFAHYPDRSFDTGIAEEHAVTLAAGMAISGLKPYLAIYSSFLQRGYDQINHDVCRMDLPVVFGIDHAGLVGPDGATHHGVFDIGLLTPLPNLILAQPKDAAEARNLVYTAFHQDHPFAIRYPKYETKSADNEMEPIAIGSWELIGDQPDHKVIVFTYGDSVHKVAEKVRINEMPVTVVNCRFLKPLDTELLDQLHARKVRMVTYEGDMLASGLGAQILQYYNDHNMPVCIRRFGIPDCYVQQGAENLLKKDLGIDLNSLMEYLLAVCEEN